MCKGLNSLETQAGAAEGSGRTLALDSQSAWSYSNEDKLIVGKQAAKNLIKAAHIRGILARQQNKEEK